MTPKDNKESWWIRLKKVIRKMKVPPMAGDGGFITDKTLIVTSPPSDSTSVVRDTITIKPSITQ